MTDSPGPSSSRASSLPNLCRLNSAEGLQLTRGLSIKYSVKAAISEMNDWFGCASLGHRRTAAGQTLTLPVN